MSEAKRLRLADLNDEQFECLRDRSPGAPHTKGHL